MAVWVTYNCPCTIVEVAPLETFPFWSLAQKWPGTANSRKSREGARSSIEVAKPSILFLCRSVHPKHVGRYRNTYTDRVNQVHAGQSPPARAHRSQGARARIPITSVHARSAALPLAQPSTRLSGMHMRRMTARTALTTARRSFSVSYTSITKFGNVVRPTKAPLRHLGVYGVSEGQRSWEL